MGEYGGRNDSFMETKYDHSQNKIVYSKPDLPLEKVDEKEEEKMLPIFCWLKLADYLF